MSKNCGKCQEANKDTAQFCQRCGESLDATQTGEHTVVVPDFRFTPGLRPMPDPVSPPGIITEQREHTVMVNDASGSMAEPYDQRMNKLLASTRAASVVVVRKFQRDPDDQVGVVSFTHKARVEMPLVPLSTHKRQIIEALQKLQAGGGTDIDRGLRAARDLFDWRCQDIVRRIMLLTDGHGGYPLDTAEDLKSRGVIIDVTGVGPEPSEVDETLLRKVASVVQGETRYRFIKDSRTLVEIYTQIAEKTATTA